MACTWLLLLLWSGVSGNSCSLDSLLATSDIPGDYSEIKHHHYDERGRKEAVCVFGPGARLEKRTAFAYDSRGKESQQVIYSADDEVLSRKIMRYDHRGQLAEQVGYDARGRVLNRNTYRYKDGKRVEWRNYSEDNKPEWIRTYAYGRQGERLEERWLDHQGALMRLYVWAYHDTGLMAGYNVYESNGQLKWRYAYDYDTQGRRIATRWYNEADALQWVRTNRWSEDGYMTGQRRYTTYRRLFSRRKDFQLKHRKEFRYDDNGNRIRKRVFDHRGRLFWDIEKEYDAQSNLVSYANYDHRGNVEYRYEMTYDKRGLQTHWRWYEGAETLIWQRQFIYDKHGQLVWEIYQ